MASSYDPSEFTPDLSGIPFEEPQAAATRLRQMARSQGLAGQGADCQLEAIFPHLAKILALAADPDGVLIYLDRFLQASAQLPDLFCQFSDNPRSLEILTTIFASSQFLSEILLRSPKYFKEIIDTKRLAQLVAADELYAAAMQAVTPYEQFTDRLDALRSFQHQHLLRIGACDLLDLFDLGAATSQLSELADALVQVCLELASRRTGVPSQGFAVLGMGKLGGQELNYSSDIDLIFIAESEQDRGGVEEEQNGSEARTYPDYRRLGERLVDGLAHNTTGGFLYRVDMRLRPWGRDGALVTSMEGYLAYLRQHAHSWEKQALLKARCIAGDCALGKAFLEQARPLIIGQGADYSGEEEQAVRRAVHASKQRTESHLRQQGRDWGEVKLGEGSIRDAEFVTQYLQIIHGKQHPEILQTNTLAAIEQLHALGLLPDEDYRILHDGYIFLRTIEHFLQLLQYQQTHTLPSQPKAFAYLARRLGYSGEQASATFLARYEQYAQAIRTVYLRYVGEPEDQASLPTETAPDRTDELLPKHLARLDAAYQAVFTPAEMRRHALMADSLDNEHLVRIETTALADGDWQITIVAYDYLGELSLICGLLYVYDLDILRGQVFTYEPLPETSSPENKRALAGGRQKIVDVFDVRPIARRKPFSTETWDRYLADLSSMLHLANLGERRQARVELAKRVALHLNEAPPAHPTPPTSLYPVDISIDNARSERYTMLQIESQDTPGFFYELTNALAFSRVNISRVVVGSVGRRVQDTLYVTEADGRKILSEERQRELRAAVILTKNFTHLLPSAPDPEAALLHFRELIEELFRRPNWVADLASLERPEVLVALARLLGVSEFMWDDLLRMQHANLFPVLKNIEGLSYPHTPAELETALAQELAAWQDANRVAGRDAGQAVNSLPGGSGLPIGKDMQPASAWVLGLNAFKDRELFRIDMRHILSYTADFEQFAAELTDLVEVVVEHASQQCYAELSGIYGIPEDADGKPARLSICALGKCGGRELGFASDIELMFIYSGSGWTAGAKSITTAEFYEKLVEKFIAAIQAPRQGIFEIDLQLRPYGKSGSLAVSLEAFERYFGPGGPAWAYERQALVRLRPIAGDAGFGERISALRDELIYTSERFDVTAMRAMRERQVRHLVAGGTFNAKYSPGGLLDLEYLVQALQINAGHEFPTVRQTNTARALDALAACGLLASPDHSQLKTAYGFLRWLIDSLRVVRGHAKDLTVPPLDSDAFAYLARRMGYGRQTKRLLNYLQRHSRAVMEINTRLLG